MLTNYLRVAWKVLLRRKFFTFISILAVSLTLLVLLVATAMLDGIFGARAPETRADHTLGAYVMAMTGPENTTSAFPGYAFLDRHARGIPGVAQMTLFTGFWSQVVSYVDGRKITSALKRTDGEYWQVLDFEFLEGGPFTAADERDGNAVAVINDSTRRRFFGDLPAVGKSLEADGQRFQVVGVVEDVPIVRVAPYADIWVPISTAKSSGYKSELVGTFMALFVAESKADLPRIREEYQARLRQVQMPDPKRYDTLHGGVESLFEAVSRMFFSSRLQESHAGRLRTVLLVLALLFMTLPSLNLININLSRILERSSEIGVRKAFGASAWTLVGQFLVENVFLTLVGAVLGLGLAAASLAAINASGIIAHSNFQLNLRVFGYGVALAVVFGLLSGVLPAWRMARFHPVEALRGRSS